LLAGAWAIAIGLARVNAIAMDARNAADRNRMIISSGVGFVAE
jgi:hypothetical protein